MWENINNVNTKVDRLREDFNEVRYYVDEHITGQLEDLQDQINKLNSKQEIHERNIQDIIQKIIVMEERMSEKTQYEKCMVEPLPDTIDKSSIAENLKKELKKYHNATDEYTTIQELINKVTEYRQNEKTYKGNQPLNTKDGVINLITAITHEALELQETILFKDEDELFDPTNLNNVKSYKDIKKELADVMIYCIALANYLEEPIFSLITDKINYNIKRCRQYGVSEHDKNNR